jgi:hypothetical protein
MDVLSGLGMQESFWNPLRFLARFRASVTGRATRRKSLPVEREVPNLDLHKYGCDVAYLCESAAPAPAPAQSLLTARLEQPQPGRQRQALRQVFDQLSRIYDAGGVLAHTAHVERMLGEAMGPANGDGVDPQPLVDFLAGPINDALAREQAMLWLADSGLKINLYGDGWEKHPVLRIFARPFDGSDAQRSAIAKSSKIILRLTPTPADDPWLMQALDSGAFFMTRYFPQDVVARIFRPLYRFVIGAAITSDEQLMAMAPPGILRLLDFARQTLGVSVYEAYPSFVTMLRKSGNTGFVESIALLPEYDRVAFSSRAQLLDLIGQYLYDEPERRRIASAMRLALTNRNNGNGTPAVAAPPSAAAHEPAPPAGEVAV